MDNTVAGPVKQRVQFCVGLQVSVVSSPYRVPGWIALFRSLLPSNRIDPIHYCVNLYGAWQRIQCLCLFVGSIEGSLFATRQNPMRMTDKICSSEWQNAETAMLSPLAEFVGSSPSWQFSSTCCSIPFPVEHMTRTDVHPHSLTAAGSGSGLLPGFKRHWVLVDWLQKVENVEESFPCLCLSLKLWCMQADSRNLFERDALYLSCVSRARRPKLRMKKDVPRVAVRVLLLSASAAFVDILRASVI